MASDGVPEEYMDALLQEFAYDPIRLPQAEDTAQLLYNRRTLETIWLTKHKAVNPYTRQPFHIKNAIPQTELRQEMQRYITENRIPGLQVISDYTKVLTESEMVCLLKDLVCPKNEKKEEADWKSLWQKLNLIRLCCQYRPENREMFGSIKGYQYLFMVVNKQLEIYYYSSDEAKELCREVARIVDVVGLRNSDLLTIPENSVQAFLHILLDLGKSEYLKIQSMVLKIYSQMFGYNIDYPLLNKDTRFHASVVHIALKLLGRDNPGDTIVDEDLDNGTAILKTAWVWKRLDLLEFNNYIHVLVNVVILCISRYREHLVSSRHGGALCIGKALSRALELMEFLLKAEDSEVYKYGYQKMMLVHLGIVEIIVGMVELVLAGFKFRTSHVRLGLSITAVLLKTVPRKMRKKEIEVFANFLRSDILKKHSSHVRQLLHEITTLATCE